MPSVKVRDNEPFDIAMRRFKRSCEKAGTLADVHRREFYEKPTQVRKRKAAAAVLLGNAPARIKLFEYAAKLTYRSSI